MIRRRLLNKNGGGYDSVGDYILSDRTRFYCVPVKEFSASRHLVDGRELIGRVTVPSAHGWYGEGVCGIHYAGGPVKSNLEVGTRRLINGLEYVGTYDNGLVPGTLTKFRHAGMLITFAWDYNDSDRTRWGWVQDPDDPLTYHPRTSTGNYWLPSPYDANGGVNPRFAQSEVYTRFHKIDDPLSPGYASGFPSTFAPKGTKTSDWHAATMGEVMYLRARNEVFGPEYMRTDFKFAEKIGQSKVSDCSHGDHIPEAQSSARYGFYYYGNQNQYALPMMRLKVSKAMIII